MFYHEKQVEKGRDTDSQRKKKKCIQKARTRTKAFPKDKERKRKTCPLIQKRRQTGLLCEQRTKKRDQRVRGRPTRGLTRCGMVRERQYINSLKQCHLLISMLVPADMGQSQTDNVGDSRRGKKTNAKTDRQKRRKIQRQLQRQLAHSSASKYSPGCWLT